KLALGKFKLGVRYDLEGLFIKRFNSELALRLGEDWGLSLKGEYDLLTGRLTRFQYGLVR
ncbi:MAG: hypothetical protein GWO44_01985, partial [Thermoplasmata archaeon]|nr:hypothetical protein [Thermoplasmata archaeon]NIY02063.1 hypothetical protein [Thermoplasmata archaeon]